MNIADRLRAMPAAESRPDGWQDVRHRLAARRAQDAQRALGTRIALAASVALIAVLATWRLADIAGESPAAVVPGITPLTAEQALALDRVAQLQSQSQALEDALVELGERPALARAGTSLPIDTLEAHVQWLDHQISAGDGAIEPRSTERLWRERVAAMNSLLRLRYVEAQRIDM
jgi:hypothetical protein